MLNDKIREGLKSGVITSASTPEVVARFLSTKVEIAEYELKVSVINAEEYTVSVKQGKKILTDPEGDGYAVDANKKVSVRVKSGEEQLDFTYVVEENKDITFDFDTKQVTEN